MSTPRERSAWQECWDDEQTVRMWDCEGAPVVRFPPRRDVPNPERSWMVVDACLENGWWEVMPDETVPDFDEVQFEEVWADMDDDARVRWMMEGEMENMSWVRE